MIHDFDLAMVTTPIGAIYWYGAIYTLGFLGVFVWFWFRRHILHLTDAEVFTLTIIFAVGVMIGGRVFDIIVYELDYYYDHPLAAVNWWAGGMASHGVILGGLTAIIVFAWKRGYSIIWLLDEVVVPSAFLLTVGRLGNFIEGGVVGYETTMPWGFIYPDLEGARHPVALYESAKNFVILPILIVALRKWPPGHGLVASLFISLYAGLRFTVDLFRDYEAAFLGIGTGQVFNLVMAAAGMVMLVWCWRGYRELSERPEPSPKRASLLHLAILAFLVLYPLGIPTSWTMSNITQKRQETLEEVRLCLQCAIAGNILTLSEPGTISPRREREIH